MRYVMEDIEAEKVPAEIRRKGIGAKQRLRVVVETLDEDLPMARIAQESGAFDFLANEPDLYTEADIRRS